MLTKTCWGIFFIGCNNLYFLLKRERGWQTFKRPGVDSFLEHLAQFYEIVIYSDQSNMVIYSLFILNSIATFINFNHRKKLYLFCFAIAVC